MAKKRMKQPRLPGAEEPTIPALDAAAENYYDAMQARVKLSKEEDEAKDNLIDKMTGQGLERYQTEIEGRKFVVSVLNKKNVKVRPSKEPEGAAVEEGE